MWDDPEVLAELRDALAGWYHTRRRVLPWREEPTPWRVWVSEIMLQQTQVRTVLPYFERFISAFPDVAALAAADEQDVLAAWSGLGYYRRARNLHAAARRVVAELGGEIPGSADALRELPGVGRYTAAAIASVAFGEAAAVLDGNVARVLARLVAQDEPVDTAAGARAQWALAEALLDRAAPSDHNQAMMELGALVCAPRAPDCAACPLSLRCVARAQSRQLDYPIKRGRVRVTDAIAVCGALPAPGGAEPSLLLARRPADALLGGLWELPGGDLDHPRAPRREALAAHLRDRLGLDVQVGGHLATVRHVFSHRRLTLEVYRVEAPAGGAATPRPRWYTDARWIDPRPPVAVPLSRLTQKVLAALPAAEVRP